MVIFHCYVSSPEGKWRFIAGNIIYKWGIFQQALLDCQRVYGFATMGCCKDVERDVEDLQRPRPMICATLFCSAFASSNKIFSPCSACRGSLDLKSNELRIRISKHWRRLRFFRNPYDMGRTRNCQEVFGPELKWWGEDGIGLQKKPCPPNNEGLSFSAQ